MMMVTISMSNVEFWGEGGEGQMRTAESIPSTISDHSPRPETPCSKHSMKRDSDSMGLSSKGMFFGALLVLGAVRSLMVRDRKYLG